MELKYVAEEAGRLSMFLREKMQLSAGLMNRLKWQDRIYVNGVARHTDYPVRPADVITVALDEPVPEYPAEHEALEVVYEDEHILAVDKPAGMLIHPSRATMTGTLANRVVGYYQRTGQKSAFHPITRLDRDTFGIVLLAKNAHVHALLNRMHTDGKLQKTYRALVYGGPKEEEGVIDAPIARRPLPSLLRYVNQDGKPSRSLFRVLWRGRQESLLELKPVTGRTHQLRVHCAYAGFPVLGDPQYGTENSCAYSAKQGLSYQQLCATALDFVHPVTKEPMHLESKMLLVGTEGVEFG